MKKDPYTAKPVEFDGAKDQLQLTRGVLPTDSKSVISCWYKNRFYDLSDPEIRRKLSKRDKSWKHIFVSWMLKPIREEPMFNWRCLFKHQWRYFIDPPPKWPEPREVRRYGKRCARCDKEVVFFTSQPRSDLSRLLPR